MFKTLTACPTVAGSEDMELHLALSGLHNLHFQLNHLENQDYIFFIF